MMIEALGSATVSQPRIKEPDQQVTEQRQDIETEPQAEQTGPNKAQSEELLQQIKSLTEDGIYSVRFERDDEANELVVKIIDNETDEVIRQMPSEELLNLTQQLQQLSGNIVSTVS